MGTKMMSSCISGVDFLWVCLVIKQYIIIVWTFKCSLCVERFFWLIHCLIIWLLLFDMIYFSKIRGIMNDDDDYLFL